MKTCKTRAQDFSNFLIYVITQFVIILILIQTFAGRAYGQSPAQGNSQAQESVLAAQVRALNNSVLQLHGQMQQGDPSSASSVRSQAATVIAQRAAALTALIEKDPRAALSFAFSPELLADLAAKFPSSASQLESHMTVSGPVERWTADYPGPNSSSSGLTMKLAKTSLHLHFAYNEPPNLRGGDVVQATGVVAGPAMAVETSSIIHSAAASTVTTAPLFTAALSATHFVGEPQGPASVLLLYLAVLTLLCWWVGSRTFRQQIRRYLVYATLFLIFLSNPGIASACTTTGVQNTAVILVTFPGTTLPTAVTTQNLNDSFFGTSTGVSLDGFVRDASYGVTSATGNVFGPYTLTGTYTSCSDIGGAVLNDAIAAAVSGGANLSSYTRVYLVFPDNFGCGWAGFASNSCTISSSSGNFNASVAYMVAAYVTDRATTVSLASHELGHNFGLMHSGTINAGTQALGPLSSPGNETDMGDYWSSMGATVLGTYPAPQKAEVLGWMGTGTNYQTVGTSGTYTLQPLETAPAGLQALKVQRGTGNNEWLWIEYRQPFGNYDTTLFPQPFSGALIHYEDLSTALGHTYLPNFTPTDTTGFSPALAAGQTWTDPYSNVSISVQSAIASGLTVSINYGATPCIHANPTLSLTPLDPSIYPGNAADYGISVTNNDPAACTSSTFNLNSSQPSGWPTAFSSSAVTLNPGQSVSLTMSKTGPVGTPPGTYAVDAIASNGTLQASGAANATVMAPPPPVTVNLTVSGSSFTRRSNVPITATVFNGTNPVAGASVVFTITKADGSKATKTVTTNSTGNANWNYKISQKDPTGAWSVVAQTTFSSTGLASTQPAISNAVTFTVQ